MTIKTVLFDLDGVVRHFDPNHVVDIESRHRLADGHIFSTAFSSPLLRRVTTGQLRRSEWIEIVGQRIGNAEAAVEWGCLTPRVDEDVVGIVDDLRSRGYVVAVLTNGTDTIPEEMRESGRDRHFDAIFSSAAIGYAKPDGRAFRHVVEALGVSVDEVFFTDDSVRNLEGAAQLGMVTHHFHAVSALREALVVAGL